MEKIKNLLENGATSAQSFNPSQEEMIRHEIFNFNSVEEEPIPGMAHCDKCKNKGYIAVPYKNWWSTIECECMPKRRMVIESKLCGLGNLLDRCTFDSFRVEYDWQKSIKKTAQEYVEHHNGDWLYIGGQIGAGKTHICTAIVREMIQKGFSAKYMLWRDEVALIKRHMNEEEYQTLLDKFRRAKLLYIDDFFKADSNPTSADINIAFEILDYRYRSNMPTIISSELLASELMNLDESIGSRIFQRASKFMLSIAKDKSKNMRTERRLT